MTVGIYALVFTDYEPIYVGQSINIEKRYKAHLYALNNESHSNNKLLNVYKKYGAPELFILEEVHSTSILDDREIFYINKFNSVNNGLNICNAPIGSCRGETHPRAVYSDEQVLQVIKLLGQPKTFHLSFTDIVELTGVKYDSVIAISKGIVGVQHRETIPIEYDSMRNRHNCRILEKHNKDEEFNSSIPKVISPEGVTYTITNIEEFCTLHKLDTANLRNVLKGVRKTHKGWALEIHKDIPTNELHRWSGVTHPLIISPEVKEYTVFNITKFAKCHGLNSSTLCQLFKGKAKSHKGWKLLQ